MAQVWVSWFTRRLPIASSPYPAPGPRTRMRRVGRWSVIAVALAGLTLFWIPRAVSQLVCPVGAVNWDGGSGNWSTATNWDTDTVPGAGDDVCIEVPGITVTVDAVQAAQSLVASSDVEITGTSALLALTNASEITGNLLISGDLDAGADLTVAGTTTWEDSRVDGSFTSTDMVLITGFVTLGGDLTNDGTVVQSDGTLSLDSDSGASFTNNGLHEFTTDFDVSETGSGAVDASYVNNGTVRKSGGAGITTLGSVSTASDIDVSNSGVFEALSGTLQVFDVVASTDTTFVLANDAVIEWDGDSTEIADISGVFASTGVGIVTWTGDYTATGPVTLDFPTGVFTLAGDLDAAGTTITNSNEVTWDVGRVDGSFTSTDMVVITGFVTLGGDLTNDGTVVQSDGTLSLDSDSGASFTNNGLHEFTTDFDVSETGSGAVDASYVNNGTVRKSGGAGITTLGSVSTASDIDVSNSGVFEALSGTLQVFDVVASTDTTFVLANDAVIEWDGDSTEIADISGVFASTGVGIVTWTGDYTATGPVTLDFPTGVFTLAGDLDAAGTTITNSNEVTWDGGRVDGSFTSTDMVLITGFVTLGGDLTNDGTVVQSDGTLSLDSDSGASFTNNGLHEFTTDFDVSETGNGAVDASYVNNGTVRKSGGAGTTTLGSVSTASDIDVSNSGVFEALSGTLQVFDVVASTDTTFVLANDAVIEWDGDSTEIADISGVFASTGVGIVTWTGDYTATGPVTLDFPTGVFTLAGDLDAAGTTITNSNEVTWDGGRVDGSFTSTDMVLITGFVTLGGDLTNDGTVVQSDGTLSLDSDSGASFTNNGLHEFTTDFDVSETGNGAVDASYVNNGTVRKSGGAGTTTLGSVSTASDIDVSNSGVFEALSGTLQVFDVVASTDTTFVLANDAVIEWDGDSTEIADISGVFASTGVGIVTWTGDYTATGPVTLDFPTGVFTLAGDLDAAGTTITNSNEVTWDGGRVDGTFTTTDTLVITGFVTFAGDFTNTATGTVLQTDGTLFLDSAVVTSFTNDGLHEFTADADNILKSGFDTDPTYVNDGTIRKSGGTGTTVFDNDLVMSSPGVIEVLSGTLDVNSDDLAQLPAATLTAGTWRVAGDATLDLGNLDSIVEVGAGATVELLGPNAAFVPLEDVATNTGSWTITDGALFTTLGALTTTGDLIVGPDSTLTVNGDFTENSVGSLHIQIAGESSTGLFGVVDATGFNVDLQNPSTLDLDLVGGFTPVAGDFYDIIFWTTRTGLFTNTIDVDPFFELDYQVDRLRLNEPTNNPPVLDPIADLSGDEETLFTFDANAGDPDAGDTLMFSLVGTPPDGAGIDPVTGVFTWTPAEQQGPGTFDITVRVTDDGNPVMFDETVPPVEITVNEVNQPPTLGALTDDTVNEGSFITFTAMASDPDEPANPLTFSLDTPPPGAGIDSTSGVFSWTPQDSDDGGIITVRVADNGIPALDDTGDVTITVNNLPPTVDAGGDQTVNVGETVSLDPATFTDPGVGDTHTATIDWGDGTAVENGFVDDALNTVSGSHVYTTADTYTVTVTVSDDDGGTDPDTFTVTVLANTAPVAEAGGPYSVEEGSTVLLDGTGSTDSDGTITSYLWSPDSNLDDATLAQPTFTAVDDDFVVMTLTVTDDGAPGLTDDDTATVTVDNVDPEVVAGADETADEGETISLDVATFSDVGTLDTHTAQIDWGDGTITDGVVDQGAETVSGSHAYGDDGVFTVTVTVTDDDFGSSSDTFTVTVGNVTPIVDPGVDQTVDEGDLVLLDPATFVDPGFGEMHTATVDWGDGSPADNGAVDDVLDTVAASHEYTDNGVFTVTVTVDDGTGGVDADTFTVTVENLAPVVMAGADQTVVIDDLVTLDPATFTDAGEDDTHTAEIDWGDGTVEAGTLDPLAGTVDGSHVYTVADTYTVTVTVTDDDLGVGFDTLTVVVDPAPNVPPTADAAGPYTVDEGSTVQLDGTGSTDSDGTIASYLWSPGTNLDDSTLAQPTFTGVDDDVVSLTLEVVDDDGAPSDPDDTTTVTVDNVAPTVVAGTDQITSVGATVNLDPATFTDPGTLDTHTAEIDWGDGTVEAGTLDPLAGTVDGSHVYGTTGLFTVAVTVSDDDGGISSDSFTVDVGAVNLPPDAVDDEFDVSEGTGDRTLDVLANDSDPESDPFTIVSNTDPALGTGSVTCSADDCTYTAPLGFIGTATFTYTIEDDGGGQDTATVGVNVLGCIDPTTAFAESGLVTGYAWEECAAPAAHELAGVDLTPLFPPTGTLLHMTTGVAVDGEPTDTANDNLGTSFRGANDVSVLRLDLDIPAPGAGEDPLNCFSFDVLFGSEEYPDFVNKPYNDGFLAELDLSDWSVIGATIDAPNNFANDNGEYISVKGSFFDPARVITDTGMVYNGSTGVLRAFTPITPGAHSLYLSIFDGADGFENSGALLDNLVAFTTATCPGGVSQPPVAEDDDFTIDEDTATEFDVLANDFDPDGDPITILQVTVPPAHGTVVVNADRTALIYTPDFNYHGADSFEYAATDIPNSSEDEPIADQSRATVSVTVIEVNDPPIAIWNFVDVPVDVPTSIDVLANDFDYDDIDGDILHIESFTDPVFGSVTCSLIECTFTTLPGYDGQDSFTYTVIDVRETDPGVFTPRGGSDTTTVYINTPPGIPDDNIWPTAEADGPYEAEVDAPIVLDGTGSFDPDGTIDSWRWFTTTDAPVTFTGTGGPTPTFTTPQNGVFRVYLVVTDNDGGWDWDSTLITSFAADITSPIDEGGSATVTVDFFNPGGDLTTTIDWGDGSPVETVDFSIFPVFKNHAYPQDSSDNPGGVYDVTVCVTGDTAEEMIDVCDIQSLTVNNVLPIVDAGIDRNLLVGGELIQSRMSFFDPGDDEPWTATVDWGDGSPEDSLEVDQATGILTMPIGHVYPNLGVFTVTICVQDDDGDGCDTFDVDVSDNAPPVVDGGGPYAGDEGATIVLDGSASSDPDGTVDTYIWTAADPLVTLTGDDTATPTFVAADNGSFEVTLQVCDDDSACSDLAVITVDVTNVAPVVEAGANQTALVNDTVSLDPATFSDAGSADTHVDDIDWGDGTVEQGVVDQVAGTVSGSHVYGADGIFTVTVTVADDDGGVGSDTFTVEVSLTPNDPPTADAGGPYTVDEGSSVLLDGTGSSDPDGTVEAYDWSPTDNLDDPTSAQPTFAGVDDDIVTVTVTVTDDDGATDSADTTVTVDNVAPTVEAGADQAVDEGVTVSLDPATFTDPGILDTHTAEIDWGDGTIESGTLDEALGTVDGSHVYPDDGVFTVTVTVTDDDGGIGSDTLTVTVDNVAPTVDAGLDQTVDEGVTVSLDPATFTDPGTFDTHTATIDWGDGTIEAGTLDQALGTVDGSHVYPDDGVFTVTVTLTDGDGGIGSDTLTVTVDNVAPTVDAGLDQTVDEGASVSLDPATFSDPGVSDTHTATIDWGDGTIEPGTVGAGVVDGSHVYGTAGTYTVTVTVTDDDGGIGSDTFTVTVSSLPTLSISDVSVDETDANFLAQLTITLSEVSSNDVEVDFTAVDGTALAGADYNATPDRITVSAGSTFATTDVEIVGDDIDEPDEMFTVELSNPANAAIAAGTATWTIVDDDGPANDSPTADPAGPYGVDEGSTVLLDGSGSFDSDGTIEAYDWSPAGNLDDATLAQPTFTGTDDDIVTMTLTVTDDGGATDAAGTTVTVNNVAPTVEAGVDQTVLVNSTVTLDPATFADPGTLDTHTAEIDWGDGTADLGTTGASTVDGSHSYTAVGTYTVTVTVTDDDGGVGTDTLTVEVITGNPPVARIVAPDIVDEGSSIALNGLRSRDFDGGIVSWLWSPADNLNDPTLPITVFTGVDDAVVDLTLTVTDNDGLSGAATITVTVLNVAPTVDAGADQTLTVGASMVLDLATFTDPGILDTHTATIDWGDGTAEAGTMGAGTVDGSHTYASEGTFTVTVTVTDDDGGVASDTLLVSVLDTNECDIMGTSGDDVLMGTSADETICGLGGNDILDGAGGNDVLLGGADDDTLIGGTGSDVLDGDGGPEAGPGTDTADYSAATAEMIVNLDTGIATGQGSDTLVAVENVEGSPQGDRITGDDTDNVLNGNAGNDVINGRGGDDTLNGGSHSTAVEGPIPEPGDRVSFAGGGAAVVVNLDAGTAEGWGDDTLAGFENVFGTEMADIITGSSVDNRLFGAGGNDTLSGGAGQDILAGGTGSDTLDGGDGIDIINAGDGNDMLFGGDGDDTLNGNAGTDMAYGGGGADLITGGDGNDQLFGEAGNDHVVGNGGDDLLFGDAGADLLEGGNGDDILFGGTGNDRLLGNLDDDDMFGESGNDRLIDGSGNDDFDGGAGRKDKCTGAGGGDTFVGCEA